MGKHLSALEKEFLIKRFQSNPNCNINDYCQINNITVQTFKKWIDIYSCQGIEGLTSKFKEDPNSIVLPEGIDPTIENYKREIMKLRIENERLKKTYTVESLENGEYRYKVLKKKNT